MNKLAIGLLAGEFVTACISGVACGQINAVDSVAQHVKGNRFSVGGYGEAVYAREFF